MYMLDARPRVRGEQLAASLSNNYATSKGTRCKVLASILSEDVKLLTNLPWILCSLLDAHNRNEIM